MPIQHIYKSSSSDGDLLYAWFMAMHTRVDIAICSFNSTEAGLLEVVTSIYHEILRLERIGNYYDAESELACANRMAALQPFPLSDELYEMLSYCKEYYDKTLGCFDVTVQSDNHDSTTLSHVRLSAEDKSLFYQGQGIRIDLSGFLKGYALEKIREILQQYSISDALISLGNSSVMALGNHPAGKGWKLNHQLILSDRCLTVSGNDSEDRQHIVFPFDGTYVHGRKRIGVVTRNAIIGEISSTALFASSGNLFEEVLESLRPYIEAYYWE